MKQQETDNSRKTAHAALATGMFWAQRVISASLEFIFALVVGFYLDQYFNTRPWLTLGFAVVGMISMFYSMIKIARQFQDEVSIQDEVDKTKD